MTWAGGQCAAACPAGPAVAGICNCAICPAERTARCLLPMLGWAHGKVVCTQRLPPAQDWEGALIQALALLCRPQ